MRSIGLSDNGKKYYNEILKSLDKKILENIDRFQLSFLAGQIDLYLRALENASVDGGVQETPNGYKQVSADISVMNSAYKQITQIGKKFGISPLDRGVLNKILTDDSQLEFDFDLSDE